MTIDPVPLGDLLPVDRDADQPPEPCSYCPGWRFEWVDGPEGGSVLREWHLADCARVANAS
jgi:hypothetical protein